MGLFGDFMALFANANRDPKKQSAFSRKDFYKFSYDTQITDDIDVSDLFQKVASRLGGTIKQRLKDSGSN